jgi:drug/metabolite transporter (DMT)-like permease
MDFKPAMNQYPAASVSPFKVHFFLILTTILWGGSFVFNKIGFREIPPLAFFALRFTAATVIMSCICFPRFSKFTFVTVKRGFMVGLALAATNLIFVIGLSGTSATRAGFLNNLFVLFIPLLCFFLWRERLGRGSLAGVMLALAGIWQLAQGGDAGFSRGDFLSTVCAVFIAIHIITVSKVLKDDDVYLVSLIQFATVMIIGWLLLFVFPQPPFRIGIEGAGALAYCAVFPTVICFTLQNHWQRHTTPTQAGLIYTLDPVWSMLGGYIVLGERMTPGEWLGCLLIFCAVLLPLIIRLISEKRHSE